MQIIIPKYIDLQSTNITDTPPLWDTSTSYVSGEKVDTYYSDRPELINQPWMTFDFFTTTDGTFDLTNSKYTWDGSQASSDNLYQTVDLKSGKDYLVVFAVSDYSAGNATSYVGGQTGTSASADGYYQQIITAGSSDKKAGVQVDAAFSGAISYVSIRQIGTTPPKKRWESQTSQSGNYPPIDDTTNWVGLGYANSWMMFDDFTSTQTIKNGNIDITVNSSKCNSLVLYNVYAKSVQVIVNDGSTDIMNETFSFYQPSTSSSYWDYFYADINRYTSMKINIPIGFDTTTRVIITPLDNQDAKCGHLQVGNSRYIGATQYGLSAYLKSWSRKDENQFGEVYLKQGRRAKKIEFDLLLEKGAFDDVFQILESLDSIPIGFDVNEETTNYTSLVIYGFYNRFRNVISHPAFYECALEIQELA